MSIGLSLRGQCYLATKFEDKKVGKARAVGVVKYLQDFHFRLHFWQLRFCEKM